LDETTGDAHLAQIAPELKTLTRVTGLHLNGSQVTDDGLSFLEGIDNIGHINLEGTAVTDAGLNHLRKMTHLGLLIVTNTKVTDAGIASLKKSLPHLRVTHLSRAESDSEKAITKAGGIEYSDADGRLTEIRFTRVGLNDGTLLDLKDHLNVWKTTLRSIDLSNCQVTDQGLEALAGLTALEQLTLKGTDVTVAGVNSLKRSVPHLKVKH
jgi:internalin A